MKKPSYSYFRLKLQEGGGHFRSVRPIIDVIGIGRATYLWVGDDVGSERCFAVTSGTERLRKFAEQILKNLPAKKQ